MILDDILQKTFLELKVGIHQDGEIADAGHGLDGFLVHRSCKLEFATSYPRIGELIPKHTLQQLIRQELLVLHHRPHDGIPIQTDRFDRLLGANRSQRHPQFLSFRCRGMRDFQQTLVQQRRLAPFVQVVGEEVGDFSLGFGVELDVSSQNADLGLVGDVGRRRLVVLQQHRPDLVMLRGWQGLQCSVHQPSQLRWVFDDGSTATGRLIFLMRMRVMNVLCPNAREFAQRRQCRLKQCTDIPDTVLDCELPVQLPEFVGSRQMLHGPTSHEIAQFAHGTIVMRSLLLEQQRINVFQIGDPCGDVVLVVFLCDLIFVLQQFGIIHNHVEDLSLGFFFLKCCHLCFRTSYGILAVV
mmetsp:Transcript_23768/g.67184  ORF Transcript_23768/g.67184 Transcript_23768/m.67184 type:complete len:354 (+) Transcript_23768:1942-3003(+)